MYTHDVLFLLAASKYACVCSEPLCQYCSLHYQPCWSCLVAHAVTVTPVHQTDRCFVSHNDVIVQTWLFLQPTVTEQVCHMFPLPQPDQTINGSVFVCLSACLGSSLEVSPLGSYGPRPRWPPVLLR